MCRPGLSSSSAWSMDQLVSVPFQLHMDHTVLQPFRRIELIVHIAIAILPHTHLDMSEVKRVSVKRLAQGHDIETTLRGEKHDIFRKSCSKRGFKSYDRCRILVKVTINRRLRIGRDGHLDQSEAYDLS